MQPGNLTACIYLSIPVYEWFLFWRCRVSDCHVWLPPKWATKIRPVETWPRLGLQPTDTAEKQAPSLRTLDKSSFIGAIPSITGVISVVSQLPGGMILQVLPAGWFPTAMPKDPAADALKLAPSATSQVLLWLPLLPQEGSQGVGNISQWWRFFPCRCSQKF